MVRKKLSHATVSKVSSPAAPAMALSTRSVTTSSTIPSASTPSTFKNDSGDLLCSGTKEFVRGKCTNTVVAASINGVRELGKSQVDESRTVVASGGGAVDVQMDLGERDVIDIPSGEEEDSDLEDSSASESDMRDRKRKRHNATEEEMADAEEANEGNSEKAEEPSFGDLLRANAPEIVDVAATFDKANPQALAKTGKRTVQLPPGMSLGTVLTQSLRTNDVKLLETCFHVRDLSTVRSTIERLDSSLAVALLQKLADRLHSRPGRAGSIMVWVQWILVAHGGYLASQPEVMRKLNSLHRVLSERANCLQPLLSLKGKLDMLEAQMNLRQAVQARSRSGRSFGEDEDQDDEDGVIYVEGQEESDSEDEERGETDDDGSGNEMDSEGEDSDSGEDGFVDDEASETDTEGGGASEDDI
ncbi:MAG: hypothetical protein FRX48_01833 [Lasallia pustulata]|uniref:Small-subunit processome Utp12 domain-containing protein n=1 Tax=Lasallia pustulata TaxID=136370 RepID=A0A5M8PZ79_9LECA|nr:MAG: hypothetical protein FRX48_01833 [Lasallia pustulata]